MDIGLLSTISLGFFIDNMLACGRVVSERSLHGDEKDVCYGSLPHCPLTASITSVPPQGAILYSTLSDYIDCVSSNAYGIP